MFQWIRAEAPDPMRDPDRRPDPAPTPWHDPGPPVRKINLPPDSPSPGVPIETPESNPEPTP
jgi:hypothetical protein